MHITWANNMSSGDILAQASHDRPPCRRATTPQKLLHTAAVTITAVLVIIVRFAIPTEVNYCAIDLVRNYVGFSKHER